MFFNIDGCGGGEVGSGGFAADGAPGSGGAADCAEAAAGSVPALDDVVVVIFGENDGKGRRALTDARRRACSNSWSVSMSSGSISRIIALYSSSLLSPFLTMHTSPPSRSSPPLLPPLPPLWIPLSLLPLFPLLWSLWCLDKTWRWRMVSTFSFSPLHVLLCLLYWLPLSHHLARRLTALAIGDNFKCSEEATDILLTPTTDLLLFFDTYFSGLRENCAGCPGVSSLLLTRATNSSMIIFPFRLWSNSAQRASMVDSSRCNCEVVG